MTRDLVALYRDCLGLTVLPDAGLAGPGTPAIVLQEAEQLFTGNHFPNRFGELWVRQCWEFRGPVAVGDQLEVSATITDVYQRKDRVVVATTHVFNLGSRKLARSVHYNSFLHDQTSGTLNLRKAAATPRPVEFEPAGELLDGKTRRITATQCSAFYNGARNYHTDPAAAAELGFSAIVIGGGMILPYICEMMDRRFGDAWRNSGSLDVKFVHVLHPDEEFVVSGKIADQGGATTGSPARVNVACQRRDGTAIAVGIATVLT